MSQDTSAQVIEALSPHKEPLYITLLASEWNSLAGGLSTLSREFAIHLAQQTKFNVRVSLLVPEGACNDRYWYLIGIGIYLFLQSLSNT